MISKLNLRASILLGLGLGLAAWPAFEHSLAGSGFEAEGASVHASAAGRLVPPPTIGSPPPDAPASGFFGLGPTFEFGNGGTRLAAAARTGVEYHIARGLRLRFEGRGLLFMAGASAGEGAVMGLIGLSAGGHL